MSYVTIPNTDVDAESPITESLMTQMRDNPIAIPNADAGTDEPPRVLCNASGATALASTDGTEGQTLQVVNEVNPGTGQSGLVIRPVTAVGTAVGRAAESSGTGTLTPTIDLPLDTDGKWSVYVTAFGGQATGYGARSGHTIFENGAIGAQAYGGISVGDTTVFSITRSVPSAGTLRIAVTYGGIGAVSKEASVSAVAIRL